MDFLEINLFCTPSFNIKADIKIKRYIFDHSDKYWLTNHEFTVIALH